MKARLNSVRLRISPGASAALGYYPSISHPPPHSSSALPSKCDKLQQQLQLISPSCSNQQILGHVAKIPARSGLASHRHLSLPVCVLTEKGP